MEDKSMKTHFTKEEVMRLETLADEIDSTGQTKYLILFLFSTGMRLCEFTSLRMSDFEVCGL